MPLKIAVQMDHISAVSIQGDTSFALSLEAQRRGHQLFHYTPDRLSMRDGKVFARIEAMQVLDEKGNHYSLGEPVNGTPTVWGGMRFASSVCSSRSG